MVYLDYSATTFVDEEVLKEFNSACILGANPNSTHKIGKLANDKINNSLEKINDLLNLKNDEIIITSGASESNNTAIKGIVKSYNIKKIITTKLEHSSIIAPASYMAQKGVEIVFCKLHNGLVDINDLISQIEENTLVSICAVDSELGIRQPIEEIAELLKEKENVIFHTDITQAIGKCEIDLQNVDLASFSAHKIYGFKGVGALIKKKNIRLEPLIHGGKSITKYRSGTPQTELIASLSKAIEKLLPQVKTNYEYVKSLKKIIIDFFNKEDKIKVNSINNIPHIINFSILGKSSEDIKQYFSDRNIYISSKTACSSTSDLSKSVLEITGDENRASSSVRVSLSYKTTLEEVNNFLEVLKVYLEEE